MTDGESLPLPCPFCGAAPLVVPDNGHMFPASVRCDNDECPAAPEVEDARLSDAIRRWNQRDAQHLRGRA